MRIWFNSGTLIPSISEIVGYKSGLALTRQELLDSIAGEDTARLVSESDCTLVTLRGEEFWGILIDILYHIGNIASPNYEWPTDELFRKYRRDSRRRKIARQVVNLFIDFMSSPSERQKSGPVDTARFLVLVAETHGVAGVRIAFEFLRIVRNFLHLDPSTRFRNVDWKDTAQLSDLFKSESLTTQYGEFFDQRYVNYLSANFDAVDKINWRKFEGLTGEFFARHGFNVNLGPGRNDGSIDVRVWRQGADGSTPPAILVQCKREKRKVNKVVVKALYADIINERAESGLIVTSTALSPGAEKVCRARA
jgi:restriction system protein